MKKLAWVGIILLALVILVFAVSGVTRMVFGRRYQAQIAAIRARGEPLTPAEVMGNPIPPAENAALVYDQAFHALDDPALEPQWKVLSILDMSTNDPAKWREAEQALPRLGKALALTEQAASMPRCRFEIDWSDSPTAPWLPYLQRMRSLGRLESINAIVAARRGDFGAAVSDVETLFGMAKSVGDSPMIIPQFSRAALLSMATSALERSLQYGDITEEQAHRLFKAAGNTDVAGGFKRAWLGQRVFAIRWYGPDRFALRVTLETEPVPRGRGSLYKQTVWRGDLAIYLGILARQVDSVTLSFPQAKKSGLFDKPVTPFYAALSKRGTASVIGPIRYDTEERLAQTQVFLALQAYKDRFGGYPATIGELGTKIGWKLPVDPFSEEDFIYKKQAKGFILYSVGPDMKDDGGRHVPDNWISSIDDKGDVVLKWDR